MLTMSEACAKCTTSSQHSLSRFSRYIMTCYYSREPDQCLLLLYVHSLKQTKVISLILIDVHLYWATLRLQRTVLSLRQTLVLRGRHVTHQNKPVRKRPQRITNRENPTSHQDILKVLHMNYDIITDTQRTLQKYFQVCGFTYINCIPTHFLQTNFFNQISLGTERSEVQSAARGRGNYDGSAHVIRVVLAGCSGCPTYWGEMEIEGRVEH